MYWLYKPAIFLFFLSFRIAALFRNDAKKWVEGRIGWQDKLKSFIESIQQKNTQRIWIHASSLGEFEQGRELIEKIRGHHPDKILILSFFSPSGFEKCKNFSFVDYVCYYPSDTYGEIRSFIELIKPTLVIFVKYDFWFNTIEILNKKKIPYCFISTIFRESHFLLNPLFQSLLNKLKLANQIFLQNEMSYKLLKAKGFENIQVSGDTRLDRVYRIANENKSIPRIDLFCDRERIFIAGSIWESDLQIIQNSIRKAINDHWRIILVPHHTDEQTILNIEKRFPGQSIRYSQLSQTVSIPILIIDQIGYLSKLYKHCLFAYVGGGFGKGIHNILEPASHKKAVCFGPNYQKFQEANDFINQRIGYVIHNSNELDVLFGELPEKQISINTSIDKYIQKNLGASRKIYQYLVSKGLLRNEE